MRGANGKEEKQALLFALLPLGLRVGQSPGCRSRWPEHPLCSVMALTHGGVCPLEADCYVTLEDSSPGNLGLSKSLGQREGTHIVSRVISGRRIIVYNNYNTEQYHQWQD